jgi:hypothetical protein
MDGTIIADKAGHDVLLALIELLELSISLEHSLNTSTSNIRRWIEKTFNCI